MALGAHLARVAFAARFVGKEMRQAFQHVAQIAPLVKDHDHTRAEQQTCLAQVFEGKAHIEHVRGGESTGCPAEQDGFHLAPAGHAACQAQQQVAQTDPERHFIHARLDDISRHAEQLCAGRFLRAVLAVCLGAVLEDIRDIAQRLDVVDHGWLEEQTVGGGEGRFDARETALAFDRFEQGSFFTADISARSPAQLNVKIKP